MCLIFAIGVKTQADYNVTWTNVKSNIVGSQGRANILNTPGPRTLKSWQLFLYTRNGRSNCSVNKQKNQSITGYYGCRTPWQF